MCSVFEHEKMKKCYKIRRREKKNACQQSISTNRTAIKKLPLQRKNEEQLSAEALLIGCYIDNGVGDFVMKEEANKR